MSKEKTSDKKEMKDVKLPGPMRMVWGALAAYWLRDIIHPSFTIIAMMILLMIPVLVVNTLFPQAQQPGKLDLSDEAGEPT